MLRSITRGNKYPAISFPGFYISHKGSKAQRHKERRKGEYRKIYGQALTFALTFVSAGNCVILMRIQSLIFLLILTLQYLANPVRSILNACEMLQLTYAACVTLEMKIAGLWLFIHTATKNMSLVLLTTAVSTVRPKKHLKLRLFTWKIEAIQKLNKAYACKLRKTLSILFGLP